MPSIATFDSRISLRLKDYNEQYKNLTVRADSVADETEAKDKAEEFSTLYKAVSGLQIEEIRIGIDGVTDDTTAAEWGYQREKRGIIRVTTNINDAAGNPIERDIILYGPLEGIVLTTDKRFIDPQNAAVIAYVNAFNPTDGEYNLGDSGGTLVKTSVKAVAGGATPIVRAYVQHVDSSLATFKKAETLKIG